MQKTDAHLLRSFRAKVRSRKTAFKRFLTRLEKKPVRGLQQLIVQIEKEVWAEVDCLSCANCCKTMSPTYTPADLKRIARHFGITVPAFKKKWLKQERGGDRDWINRSTPCQFLNTKSNKCSIYAIRPLDCSGFPHLPKKFVEYAHVHKQNLDSCPATFLLVEKLSQQLASRS
ncbi:MAG: YkgJ family cysteine cluster protein [Sphingomonadales bacterium]